MGGKLNIWYLLHIVDSGTPACFIGKLNIFIKIECSQKVLICSINSVTYILRISVNTSKRPRLVNMSETFFLRRCLMTTKLPTVLSRWPELWKLQKSETDQYLMTYELGSNVMLKRTYFSGKIILCAITSGKERLVMGLSSSCRWVMLLPQKDFFKASFSSLLYFEKILFRADPFLYFLKSQGMSDSVVISLTGKWDV